MRQLRHTMRGCITALLTPFGDKYEVNLELYEQLIDFQSSNGIQGMVVAGTTGEGPTLEMSEWEKLLNKALEVSKENLIVIANAGSNNTLKTTHYTSRPHNKNWIYNLSLSI